MFPNKRLILAEIGIFHEPNGIQRCLSSLGDDALNDAFYLLFHAVQLFAEFLVKLCMDIPFVAIGKLDFLSCKHGLFDLIAMCADILLVLPKCTVVVCVLSAFRVSRAELHHSVNDLSMVVHVLLLFCFVALQLIRTAVDRIADQACKGIPTKICLKYDPAVLVKLVQTYPLRGDVLCEISVPGLDAVTVLIADGCRKVGRFFVAGICRHDTLLSWLDRAVDDALDKGRKPLRFFFLCFPFRFLLLAVLLYLFFAEIFLIVNEISDPICNFFPRKEDLIISPKYAGD